MKKKELNLEQLSIKSFVTEIVTENVNTVKGGGWTNHLWCTIAVCEQGATNPGAQTC